MLLSFIKEISSMLALGKLANILSLALVCCSHVVLVEYLKLSVITAI